MVESVRDGEGWGTWDRLAVAGAAALPLAPPRPRPATGRGRRAALLLLAGALAATPEDRGPAAACGGRPGGIERGPPHCPEEPVIDVYFDFSCPYSRRTGRWWRALGEPARWRPFLLRESHRDGDGPAEWDRDDALGHVSVLALALHEAVHSAGGDAASYRWEAMELFDRGRVDPSALRQLAAGAAGRDLDDDALREGLAAVGRSHAQAVAWQVFGTPTLVDGAARAYLKLAEDPAPERGREVHDAVLAVLTGPPEILEIKRPG